MKPIKIIMSAFGSYPDLTEISFEPFEKNGLFLITGPTGSGKTTIFDAICYALYGSASGEYRDASQLRNENAPNDVKTYVEFWFSHQGKTYHVVRNPEYTRNKDRGTGTTTEKANATLYEGDKPVASGPRDVGKAVLELLSVQETQFKQIVMIAQGEFRKVLNASTKERTEILRNIFSTGGYERIGEELKNRRAEISRQSDAIESSILQYLAGALTEEGSQKGEELRTLTDNAGSTGSAWNASHMTAALAGVIDEEKELLDDAETALKNAKTKEEAVSGELSRADLNNNLVHRVEELRSEAAELDKKRETISQLRALTEKRKKASRIAASGYDAWKKSDTEKTRLVSVIKAGSTSLEALKEKAEKAARTLEEQENRRPESEKYNRKAGLIAADKEKYQERDALKTGIEKMNEEERRLEGLTQKLEQRGRDLEDRIGQLRNTVQELKNKPDEKRNAEDTKKELESLLNTINGILDNKVPEYKERKASLEDLETAAEKALAEFEKARKARETAEIIFGKSQLGLLAKGLKEGEKCPVCGSTHHPEPATLPDESVTAVILESLKEKEEKLRSSRDRAVTDKETAAAELRLSEEHLRNIILDCVHDAEGVDTDSLIDKVKNAGSETKTKIRELSDTVRKLSDDCKKLEDSQAELEKATGEETAKLSADKEEHRKALEELHVKLTEKKTRLSGLESLRYDDWEAAEKAKTELEAKAKEILDSIEAASAAKQQAVTAVTDKEAEIRTNTESLSRVSAETDEALDKLEKLIKENGFISADEMLTYRTGEPEIAEAEKTITEFDQKTVSNADQLRQAIIDAEGRTLIDEELLKKELEECRKTTEHADEYLTALKYRIETNSGILSRIEESVPELERKKKEHAMYDRLYRLVSGQISGTGRITLEQYVQMSSFDRIINAANRRMYPLSNKQYELRRRTQFKGLGAGEYLDLDVLCVSNGKRRPAGNVSGGESFLASLSLALGLSDTISSDMGGIQMDALFIDEGFGSLDSELLDTTLGVLLDQSGPDKLIGIISHREELGDIPQKIKVSKDSYGSHIEIELDT